MEYQRSLCTQFEMPRASRIARVTLVSVCVFCLSVTRVFTCESRKAHQDKRANYHCPALPAPEQQQTWDAPAAPTAWDLCPTSPKARVCLSRRQHSPKLDSPDSSGVWATLQVAAAVVIKSSNSLMLPQRWAAEPQRVVFSLTPFSAAEPQLRHNIDVSLCVLAPQAVVDPTPAQVSKKPRHQIKSGTSGHCFIAELWHHSAQSKLKIKPFMSAYLSAWEMRLTQGTVHSAMRSGPRSPPLPVPRQRSTITFPQRRMACGAASASAGMHSLSDRRPFRAAPQEASTRFQGTGEAEKQEKTTTHDGSCRAVRLSPVVTAKLAANESNVGLPSSPNLNLGVFVT